MQRRGFENPFYIVLTATGIAFCLTATAYCSMMIRAGRALDAPPLSRTGTWLNGLMEQHGSVILGSEIVILLVTAVVAITTDQYWSRRQQLPPKERSET